MIRFHPDVGFSVFFFHFASAGKVKYATEIDETVAMLELLDATWLMVVIPLMPLVIFPEFPKMLSLHDRHRSTCIYWVITNKVNDLVEKLTQSIWINPICDKKKEKNMFIQINPESWCRKKHKIKYFMFQSSGLLNSLIQRLASSHLVSPGDVSICSGRKWYVCHFLVLSPSRLVLLSMMKPYTYYIYCCMIDIFHLKTDYLMVKHFRILQSSHTHCSRVHVKIIYWLTSGNDNIHSDQRFDEMNRILLPLF